MNLHIENQKMRFRISKEEIKNLCASKIIKQHLLLPKGQSLNIEIIAQEQNDELYLSYEKSSIILQVQKTAANNLYEKLPSRKGLEVAQELENNQILHLILEVDIRTQKKQNHNKELANA